MKNLIKASSNKIGNIKLRKRRHLIQGLKPFEKNHTLGYFFKKPRPTQHDVKLGIVNGQVNVFPTENFIIVF